MFCLQEEFQEKGTLTGLYSFITVVSCKEEFQSMISLQKTAQKTRHALSFLIAMLLGYSNS